MTSDRLLVIIPTRGRPERIPLIVDAWRATDAFTDGARLLFAYDADDPKLVGYIRQRESLVVWVAGGGVHFHQSPEHRPMVHKLNAVAAIHAMPPGAPFAVGFAGDDHLPKTRGWAREYLDVLREMGTGIVYGRDGYQDENLATQWAMTTDIVQTLGRMVPAPVEHLYCDNAIMDLGRAVGRLVYLPEVLIEHQHPVAGHPGDEQHDRVNSSRQYRTDRPAYRAWRDGGGLNADARAIAEMIKAKEQR